jgi:RNA polymerase-interacting CarD/CdnL/TRCF family regulator
MESNIEFTPGTDVIYGFHGRCRVQAIETKPINGEEVQFYKLEIQKSQHSRSSQREPNILLPVQTASKRGLRNPLSNLEAEKIWEILENREYYFSLTENWRDILPTLEKTIVDEGALGLAKVSSYLYALTHQRSGPPRLASQFEEKVDHLLVREISDATDETIVSIEARKAKVMRGKLKTDNLVSKNSL